MIRLVGRGAIFGCLLFLPLSALRAADVGSSCDQKTDERHFAQIVTIHECASKVIEDPRAYADQYARWTVKLVETKPANFYRDYESEKRFVLIRLLAGQTRSSVVSLKLRMTNPGLEFTIPLVAASYEGKVGKGESFTTALTDSNGDQPYFRTTASTSTSLILSANLTKDAESQIAARSLPVLQSAVKMAAPQVALITELSKADSNRISSAIDTTLASLMSETLSETITAASVLGEPGQPKSFRVVINMPRQVPLRERPKQKGEEPDAGSLKKQGQLIFQVELSCPRPSIFYARTNCDGPAIDRSGLLAAMKENVSAQEVLSFELAPGQTIRQRIVSREFFLNFLKDSEVIRKDTTGERLASFCDAVLTDMRSVGLSTLDVQVAVWATVSAIGDLAFIRPTAEDAAKSRTCSSARPAQDWSFTRAPA